MLRVQNVYFILVWFVRKGVCGDILQWSLHRMANVDGALDGLHHVIEYWYARLRGHVRQISSTSIKVFDSCNRKLKTKTCYSVCLTVYLWNLPYSTTKNWHQCFGCTKRRYILGQNNKQPETCQWIRSKRIDCATTYQNHVGYIHGVLGNDEQQYSILFNVLGLQWNHSFTGPSGHWGTVRYWILSVR